MKPRKATLPGSGRRMTQPLSIGEWVPIAQLRPWAKNPRKNDGEPTERVAESIKRFGFVAPIVIWKSVDRMVAGHTRLKAMQSLLRKDVAFVPKGAPAAGLVPVRFHEFASEAEADLYAMADNKLNEIAAWDDAAVADILAGYSQHEQELAGFLAAESADLPEEPMDASQPATDLVFRVMVECDDERHQALLVEELESKGLKCKPLTL